MAKNAFTITWTIENASYIAHEVVNSPCFSLAFVSECTCHLSLNLEEDEDDEWISLFLHRDDDTSTILEIDYELAILPADGSTPVSDKKTNRLFGFGEEYGFLRLVSGMDVFQGKKTQYLSRDTLTVQCRIWKCDLELPVAGACFVRTRLEIERIIFIRNFPQFVDLKFDSSVADFIVEEGQLGQLAKVELFLDEESGTEENVQIEISTLPDNRLRYLQCKLSVLDVANNVRESVQDEMWFGFMTEHVMPTFLSMKKLMEQKEQYLPNDVLSLRFEITYSKGRIAMESVRYAPDSLQATCPLIHGYSYVRGTVNMDENNRSNSLKEDFKTLYDSRILCDVKIQTATDTFPTHSVVLSARSPVFRAMFSNDMKEKSNSCVDITDLDDDTVRRLLVYIYTDTLEDLHWEQVLRLYVAADKYEMLVLKNECCFLLKNSLSPTNVCEVLAVADMHRDDDLKKAAQNYIFAHGKEIFCSNEWNKLMKNNVELAAETMLLKCTLE